MHDLDLPTYCCAHGRLIVHTPVGGKEGVMAYLVEESVKGEGESHKRHRPDPQEQENKDHRAVRED